MKSITISDKIKEKCPNLVLGCLSFDIDYETSNPLLLEDIQSACQQLQNKLTTPDISQISTIKNARKAYKSLGKDPARYRLSAEALLRRVVKGKGIYQINNIVDILNLVSIQTGYSIGGYNTEKIVGNITLGIGEENEPYQGIGRGELNITNLPMLRDEKGAFGSPTSDSLRTMVTEETNHFLMVFFDFGGETQLEKTLEDSIQIYQKYSPILNIKKQLL